MIARMAERSLSRQGRMLVMQSPVGRQGVVAGRMTESSERRLERNCSSGNRSLIAPWCYGELSDEGARHVALVREARKQRGVGRRPALGQVPPHQAHSALNEIGMRRCPHVA